MLKEYMNGWIQIMIIILSSLTFIAFAGALDPQSTVGEMKYKDGRSIASH